MISVIIPTLNAEQSLSATLTALVPAAIDGLIREVIVVDGGSSDRTLKIADAAGAEIVRGPRGRGPQLIAGARAARFRWLLFLHADTVLEAGWESECAAFIERVEIGQRPPAAAAFKLALDDLGIAPRIVEAGVAFRSSVFRLPYGDQGLLIPAALYDQLGGFKPLVLMEDVDIVRRLGRSRTILLRSRAITAATRYRRDGYVRRVLRNWSCLALYFMRVSPQHLVRIYR